MTTILEKNALWKRPWGFDHKPRLKKKALRKLKLLLFLQLLSFALSFSLQIRLVIALISFGVFKLSQHPKQIRRALALFMLFVNFKATFAIRRELPSGNSSPITHATRFVAQIPTPTNEVKRGNNFWKSNFKNFSSKKEVKYVAKSVLAGGLLKHSLDRLAALPESNFNGIEFCGAILELFLSGYVLCSHIETESNQPIYTVPSSYLWALGALACSTTLTLPIKEDLSKSFQIRTPKHGSGDTIPVHTIPSEGIISMAEWLKEKEQQIKYPSNAELAELYASHIRLLKVYVKKSGASSILSSWFPELKKLELESTISSIRVDTLMRDIDLRLKTRIKMIDSSRTGQYFNENIKRIVL